MYSQVYSNGHAMDRMVFVQIPHIEVLTPKVIALGDEGSRKQFMFNEVRENGKSLRPPQWGSLRRERVLPSLLPRVCTHAHRGKAALVHRKLVASVTLEEASELNSPVGFLILDFVASRTQRSNFLLLKPST